ncbi:MAG: DUF420 domain-containing protein [Flavobacteriales bacterium]|nr:DUF420 domain-containing protein [Flavobacteriales bacterium]MCW8912454.1 DUF420 domain-containing protein [Flavobacteriales bacterium]MCW8936538.1 DUF420 domain-containing protein [Flavobacteriales bacterium]MCW8940853.1 DUF420 domain-containing protein [Flavobacteriales bacterium]MCW8968027.1 DUF420 domain-containing protein [Flavobacteriales bacterium]
MKNKTLIIIISIALPLAVTVLFNVKLPNVEPLSFLPPIYAGINSITVFTLIFAVIAIKKNKRKLHEMLVKTSLALSTLFLLMYIAYHITSDPTKFGGDETTKIIYFVILISHIILSVTIIPLVLITYNRALLQEFDKHKKIARITFPLWLYVAISGVIVYWMISPYYI